MPACLTLLPVLLTWSYLAEQDAADGARQQRAWLRATEGPAQRLAEAASLEFWVRRQTAIFRRTVERRLRAGESLAAVGPQVASSARLAGLAAPLRWVVAFDDPLLEGRPRLLTGPSVPWLSRHLAGEFLAEAARAVAGRPRRLSSAVLQSRLDSVFGPGATEALLGREYCGQAFWILSGGASRLAVWECLLVDGRVRGALLEIYTPAADPARQALQLTLRHWRRVAPRSRVVPVFLPWPVPPDLPRSRALTLRACPPDLRRAVVGLAHRFRVEPGSISPVHGPDPPRQRAVGSWRELQRTGRILMPGLRFGEVVPLGPQGQWWGRFVSLGLEAGRLGLLVGRRPLPPAHPGWLALWVAGFVWLWVWLPSLIHPAGGGTKPTGTGIRWELLGWFGGLALIPLTLGIISADRFLQDLRDNLLAAARQALDDRLGALEERTADRAARPPAILQGLARQAWIGPALYACQFPPASGATLATSPLDRLWEEAAAHDLKLSSILAVGHGGFALQKFHPALSRADQRTLSWVGKAIGARYLQELAPGLSQRFPAPPAESTVALLQDSLQKDSMNRYRNEFGTNVIGAGRKMLREYHAVVRIDEEAWYGLIFCWDPRFEHRRALAATLAPPTAPPAATPSDQAGEEAAAGGEGPLAGWEAGERGTPLVKIGAKTAAPAVASALEAAARRARRRPFFWVAAAAEAVVLARPSSRLPGFIVAAAHPLAPIATRLRTERDRIAVVLAGLVLLVAAAAALLSGWLAAPLVQIARALRAVQHGRRALDVQGRRDDQLGRAVEVLQRMVGWLRERETIGRFVSPRVLELVSRGDAAELARGRQRDVVLLVSDIRSFTTLSETHPPAAIFQLLNDHLGAMTPVIQEHGGTIDRFIGDAIQAAFFAAPGEGSIAPAAARAVRAAAALRQAHRSLQDRRQAAGLFPYAIGIGLAGGSAITGVLGDPEVRLDFTVLGDPLARAHEREAASKQARASFIVAGEEFVDVLEPGWQAVPLPEHPGLFEILPPDVASGAPQEPRVAAAYASREASSAVRPPAEDADGPPNAPRPARLAPEPVAACSPGALDDGPGGRSAPGQQSPHGSPRQERGAQFPEGNRVAKAAAGLSPSEAGSLSCERATRPSGADSAESTSLSDRPAVVDGAESPETAAAANAAGVALAPDRSAPIVLGGPWTGLLAALLWFAALFLLQGQLTALRSRAVDNERARLDRWVLEEVRTLGRGFEPASALELVAQAEFERLEIEYRQAASSGAYLAAVAPSRVASLADDLGASAWFILGRLPGDASPPADGVPTRVLAAGGPDVPRWESFARLLFALFWNALTGTPTTEALLKRRDAFASIGFQEGQREGDLLSRAIGRWEPIGQPVSALFLWHPLIRLRTHSQALFSEMTEDEVPAGVFIFRRRVEVPPAEGYQALIRVYRERGMALWLFNPSPSAAQPRDSREPGEPARAVRRPDEPSPIGPASPSAGRPASRSPWAHGPAGPPPATLVAGRDLSREGGEEVAADAVVRPGRLPDGTTFRLAVPMPDPSLLPGQRVRTALSWMLAAGMALGFAGLVAHLLLPAWRVGLTPRLIVAFLAALLPVLGVGAALLERAAVERHYRLDRGFADGLAARLAAYDEALEAFAAAQAHLLQSRLDRFEADPAPAGPASPEMRPQIVPGYRSVVSPRVLPGDQTTWANWLWWVYDKGIADGSAFGSLIGLIRGHPPLLQPPGFMGRDPSPTRVIFGDLFADVLRRLPCHPSATAKAASPAAPQEVLAGAKAEEIRDALLLMIDPLLLAAFVGKPVSISLLRLGDFSHFSLRAYIGPPHDRRGAVQASWVSKSSAWHLLNGLCEEGKGDEVRVAHRLRPDQMLHPPYYFPCGLYDRDFLHFGEYMALGAPFERRTAWRASQREGQVSLRTGTGTAEILVVGKVPEHAADMIALAAEPVGQRLDEFWRAVGWIRWVLVGLLAVTVMLADRVARRFLAPLLAFTEGAERFMARRLGVRLPVERSDEFGALAVAFNDMAAGVEAGERLRRFVSEPVRRAARDPAREEAARRGEQRFVVVLFAGLPGFKDALHADRPDRLVAELNRYLQAMSRQIRAHGGEIDKFIGDKILAVFDPDRLDGPAAAAAAVAAARAMAVALARLPDFPLPHLGIGMVMGPVLSGILGSPDVRLEYTVIGDTVNLASRLCDLAQAQPAGGLVVEAEVVKQAAAANPSGFMASAFQRLPVSQVKGKTRAVEAFLYAPRMSDPMA
ncbi:MAG: Adenylate cyclase [Candidatus Ozemobacter sibiricus]|uniref:Adenylate cyclase n=1 Tax=Candidatus Ozemobacter sibiricus TaxID=2268124 RepID=A0A367ZIE1_9BACT|nr:MAG: Adenylate cyclase [Candidatus Ozemobacter sibiricus]